MGNYLYDKYEARLKYSSDEINDWTFYTKLKHNFVSPKKVFKLVQIIFMTMKCAPYHTKFLQVFYNNINILERDEYFVIVEQLKQELLSKNPYHISFNIFNNKLREIKSKIKDKTKFNYGLVKTKEEALKFFFSYVNFYKSEFEKIKNKIDSISEEIKGYLEIKDSQIIKKVIKEETGGIISTYLGQISNNNIKEGKGILILKNKLGGNIISEYIGEFKNDKKNGFGVLKHENTQFEGIFDEDELDGLAGVYFEDKIEIIEINKGIKNGRAISFFKEGDIETTIYEKNMKTNIYSYYDSKNKELFTGKKFDDGNYEGIKYYDKEGSVDVGFFNSNKNLMNEGYNYRDYNGFYGLFKNGNIEPSFCFRNDSNGYIFKGTCNEQGKMEGNKIKKLIYTNDSFKGDIYIGGCKNDLYNDFGEYYWGYGDYHKGYFPVGWGVRYFICDDSFIEGVLVGGFAEGEGYLTYDKKKYHGNFDLNQERCLFLADNGKVIKYWISNKRNYNEAITKQYKTEINN